MKKSKRRRLDAQALQLGWAALQTAEVSLGKMARDLERAEARAAQVERLAIEHVVRAEKSERAAAGMARRAEDAESALAGARAEALFFKTQAEEGARNRKRVEADRDEVQRKLDLANGTVAQQIDALHGFAKVRDALLRTLRGHAIYDALAHAEAALADIGDAAREPGDDLKWCEERAAKALPRVRAALRGTAPEATPDPRVRASGRARSSAAAEEGSAPGPGQALCTLADLRPGEVVVAVDDLRDQGGVLQLPRGQSLYVEERPDVATVRIRCVLPSGGLDPLIYRVTVTGKVRRTGETFPLAAAARVPDARTNKARAADALDKAVELADGTDAYAWTRAARRWLHGTGSLTDALESVERAMRLQITGTLHNELRTAEMHLRAALGMPPLSSQGAA